MASSHDNLYYIDNSLEALIRSFFGQNFLKNYPITSSGFSVLVNKLVKNISKSDLITG